MALRREKRSNAGKNPRRSHFEAVTDTPLSKKAISNTPQLSQASNSSKSSRSRPIEQTAAATALCELRETPPTPLNDDDGIQLLEEDIEPREEAAEELEERISEYRSYNIEWSVVLSKKAIFHTSCF